MKTQQHSTIPGTHSIHAHSYRSTSSSTTRSSSSTTTITVDDIKLQSILSQLNLAEQQRLRQLLAVIEFDNQDYLETVDTCWDPNVFIRVEETGESNTKLLARTAAIEKVQSRGSQVSPRAAMERIMLENPDIFTMGLPVEWVPRMRCGGSFAIDRAIYLI